jgi:hypothetical protein
MPRRIMVRSRREPRPIARRLDPLNEPVPDTYTPLSEKGRGPVRDLVSTRAGATSTGAPSPRTDRSPAMTASEPSNVFQVPSGDPVDRTSLPVTSTQVPSLTPVCTGVRAALPSCAR